MDAKVASELRALVGRALGVDHAEESAESLWLDLQEWAYRENLEQRLLGREVVDPIFVAALREKAADSEAPEV